MGPGMIQRLIAVGVLILASLVAAVAAQQPAPAPQFATPAPVPPLFFREAWRQTGRMDAASAFTSAM